MSSPFYAEETKTTPSSTLDPTTKKKMSPAMVVGLVIIINYIFILIVISLGLTVGTSGINGQVPSYGVSVSLIVFASLALVGFVVSAIVGRAEISNAYKSQSPVERMYS